MNWLPFVCLIAAVGVLAVLYSRTVGHIHRMVHMLDEALGIHEERLNAYSADLAQIASILETMSRAIHEETGKDLL